MKEKKLKEKNEEELFQLREKRENEYKREKCKGKKEEA